MLFTLNEELTVIEGIEDKTVCAPREHPFTMQTVGGQTLAVYTETSSGELLLPFLEYYWRVPNDLLPYLLRDEALVTTPFSLFHLL